MPAMTKPANPRPHAFQPAEHDRDRCAKCDRKKNRPWHDMFRYRFPEGTRVRVKPDISVPEWATSGTVVSNPGPDSDWYGHPLVRWDRDNKQRHVSSSWLVKIRTDNRNYQKIVCDCGRIIRMAAGMFEAGPVICGICAKEFYTAA